MSTSHSARKRLPVKPSIENLKKQAKRLAKVGGLQLSDAQQQLAADYGCRDWAELSHVVDTMLRGADQLESVQAELEPLPACVRKDDSTTFERLLTSGDFTQHDLDKALAHSVWYEKQPHGFRKEMADLLLDYGADPNGQYGSAYGPLVLGCGECLNLEGLKFLLDAGADVAFAPVETKYGNVSILSHTLGTYVRGRNDQKHAMIDLLIRRGAPVPPEVTDPVLAIHQGDAARLDAILSAQPDLVGRRFPKMPYGNIALDGATLLHCAVEFDEPGCVDVLLRHGADINARADVIDGVGGQTPIFHTLNTGWDGKLNTLKHLVDRAGSKLDASIAATWRTYEGPRAKPSTALEFAEEPGDPTWRKNADAERALLRTL